MNSARIKELLEDLKRKLESKLNVDDITQRDRYILYGCVGFISLVLIYLVVFSFSGAVSNLEKQVLALETDLQKVSDLKNEYISSTKQFKELVKDNPKQPLISTVEKILISQNIERKKFSIQDRKQRNKETEEIYSEKTVDVSIKQIPLGKMIDVLYALQSRHSYLKVKDFRVRTRFDNSNSVDLFFKVSTFEFNEVG